MKSQHFQDFDAFASSIRGIESKMMMRSPKRRVWSVSAVDLDGIDVQIGRLGSGNIAAGQLRADGYLLYLPLTDACEYSANGTVLDKHSFAILEPGCEFCISTKVEHDWCAVTIPQRLLAHDADFVEPPSRSEKTTVRVTGANRHLANQFRAIAGQIMFTAANCSQFETAPAARSAAAELLRVASSVIKLGQAGEPNQEGRPRLPRQEIIRRTTVLLEERDGQRLLVRQLAAAAQVSERTLRTAFNEYFGVGPIRYLQLRQLHQVRRALRTADPEAVTVSDVLLAHGEWEFSRFASRYRRLFGELPSETLQR